MIGDLAGGVQAQAVTGLPGWLPQHQPNRGLSCPALQGHATCTIHAARSPSGPHSSPAQSWACQVWSGYAALQRGRATIGSATCAGGAGWGGSCVLRLACLLSPPSSASQAAARARRNASSTPLPRTVSAPLLFYGNSAASRTSMSVVGSVALSSMYPQPMAVSIVLATTAGRGVAAERTYVAYMWARQAKHGGG